MQVFRARVRGPVRTLALAILLGGGARLAAGDFIRGDVNGDGALTVADAHGIYLALHSAPESIPCANAADVDDSGAVDAGDTVRLLSFVLLNGTPPQPPFPEMGPDPTPSELPDCQSYGGGGPLEDPAAALKILDTTVKGDDSAHATITLTVSNSRPIGGFVASIRLGDDIVEGIKGRWDIFRIADENDGFSVTLREDGGITVAYLTAAGASEDVSNAWIAEGMDRKVVRFSFCLKSGTASGFYPMTIESGELIDWESGRSIQPALEAGTIKVFSDAGIDPICSGEIQLNATYMIGDTTVTPGAEVVLPFVIRSSLPVPGYTYSVDFDEQVLEGIRVERVWTRPDGMDFDIQSFEFDNRNDRPGNSGVNEGFLWGVVVIDTVDPTRNMLPADEDVLAFNFHFRVREDAVNGMTKVRFQDGAKTARTAQPVENRMAVYANERFYTFLPELARSFVFVDGRITVLGDIAVFSRGDSNGDQTVDISDASATLDHLFLGGAQPSCYDAADFNDDGSLDIADPVGTLQYLFLDGQAPRPPFGTPGKDPTEDSMGCLYQN